MLNRPTHDFSREFADRGPLIDGRPGLRLALMFTLLLVPIFAITWRVVAVQTRTHDALATELERTVEFFEPIPARDGRILGTDGSVLAEDVLRFEVHMHYRWLEHPADSRWLDLQVNRRLTRKERRSRPHRQTARQQIEQDRADAWHRLAELLEIDEADLTQKRASIQNRVERMIASVERTREERARRDSATAADGSDSDAAAETDKPWQRAWDRFRSELTTPPHRQSTEPIVFKEELDYHAIESNVPLEIAAEIQAHPELYPGVRVIVATERRYLHGSLAAHIIGIRSSVGADEIAARREQFPNGDPLDYRVGDRIGRDGVERSFDATLRGVWGSRRVVRNRRGEVVHTSVVREPSDGRDVQLTLDTDLQARLEWLLADALGDVKLDTPELESQTDRPVQQVAFETETNRPKGGSIIVMDIWNGDVKAMASAPTFDLELMRQGDADAIQRWNNDARHPFVNRSIQMALPPGSVFKTLTAVAVLESGKVDPDEPFRCRGYLDNPGSHRCYHGLAHLDTTLVYALCRSCNVYFFDRARRIGASELTTWAKRFGFGQTTGIDLPGERRGNVPTPDQSHWYSGDTMGVAIGQSRLTATPLQIARMMAAVANGGELVAPRVAAPGFAKPWASGPQVGEQQLVATQQRRKVDQLRPDLLSRVREGLEMVVQHPRGTAYRRVRLDEIRIAGKTGTAQAGGDREDHAWFAGYVPANAPRFAFVVVLEHGGSGGQVAGPLAKSVVENLLDLGLVQPGTRSGG